MKSNLRGISGIAESVRIKENRPNKRMARMVLLTKRAVDERGIGMVFLCAQTEREESLLGIWTPVQGVAQLKFKGGYLADWQGTLHRC